MRAIVWRVEPIIRSFCGLVLALGICMPAAAEDGAKDPDAQLKVLEQSREATEVRLKGLKQDARRFAEENQELSRKLAAAAEAVRTAERDTSAAESAVDDLDAQILDRTNALIRRRKELAATLSALLGITRMPPLAAVAQPGQVAENALTASALAGITPVLQGRVAGLQGALRALERPRKPSPPDSCGRQCSLG